LRGEVKNGNFEVIPEDNVGKVFNMLKNQTVLTKLNFLQNLNQGNEAWEIAAGEGTREGNDDGGEANAMTSGIGEEYDEEDDRLVFKSDVRVAKLSDDARMSWIACFMLGAPSLGA
jgi:hypothetical protein